MDEKWFFGNVERHIFDGTNLMQEVIRASGNKNYRIPHVRKAALSRQGVLPEVVVVEKDVIESRLRLLSATDVEAKAIELCVEVANWLEMGDICSQLEQLDVENEDDEIDMLELLQLNIRPRGERSDVITEI
ncbi:hypothetical protein DYB25_007029 [Aphanomyces astaci]|uniref:Uncharacterized protein n=1 Tax=Aphanomyces astaci TaxID=112090 RepID=A0A397C6F3_APHAT|nr:hypothetical protein DYB25_007029 [Aphanomyces astaci]